MCEIHTVTASVQIRCPYEKEVLQEKYDDPRVVTGPKKIEMPSSLKKYWKGSVQSSKILFENLQHLAEETGVSRFRCTLLPRDLDM
jgi:hypothetical protein